MSLDKHLNLLYSGTTPLNLGDRYYSQDLIRDLLYSWDNTGQTARRILGTFPALLMGGVVTVGAGAHCLDITEAWGVCNYSVEHPDTFAALPPSKTSSDIARLVHAASQNELDTSGLTTPATADGATPNYVKLRYTEANGNTRTRARAAGTYSYEVTPSYTYYCDAVAPTDYDVLLATVTITAPGVVTITNQYFPKSIDTLRTDMLTASKGALYGLILSNAADTAHDITIAVGSCLDSTGAYVLNLSSAIIKQIDAAWAVGTNAGGLDTGAVGASTEYFLWLIRKDGDGTIDVLFSASATAPTMPAGYTYKRLLRGVRTDAGSNIVNNQFLITDVINDREAVISVQDQKAQNTAGGTFTAGAWRTRDLNTVTINEIPGASVASNQITLPAGYYNVTAAAPAAGVGITQIRLYDTTGTVQLVLGANNYGPSAAVNTQCQATLSGSFYLSVSSVIELQHYSQGTLATTGFGYALNIGIESYSHINIIKRG